MLPRMVEVPLIPVIEIVHNLSHAESGMLMSSYFYAYAVMQAPAGFLSDRYGRKTFIIIGILGSSLASVVMGGVQTYPVMILLRAIAGFFSGMFWAPAMSLLTESVGEKNRAKAFGFAMLGSTVTNAINYSLIMTLGLGQMDYMKYYVLTAIPGFFCAAIYLLAIKDARTTHLASEANTSHDSSSAISKRQETVKVLRDRRILGVLAATFFTLLVYQGVGTFLPTFMVRARYVTPIGATEILMSYALPAVVAGLLAGYLVDRRGVAGPTIVGMMIAALAIIGIAVLPIGIPMAISLAAYGLFISMPNVSLLLPITRLSSPRIRGSVLGIYNSVLQASSATGPLLLGYIADKNGFGYFFLVAAVLWILGIVSLYPTFSKTSTSAKRI